MLARIIVVALLIGIVASLGSAMYYLVRDRGSGSGTVRALTVRISLSVFLFVLLLVFWKFGLIQPHGLVPPAPG
jgi:hypothetical protein